MKLIKTAIDFHNFSAFHDFVILGDWCLKDLDDILGNIDKFNKVPYHWDDREKYANDYVYLTELYEKTLSLLAASLNEIHSTDYDSNYWRIIIGPWLRYFIDVLFDRYECVKQANLDGRITQTTIYPYDLEDFCPADFADFYSDIETDEWNEVVFSECLVDLGIPRSFSAENLVVRKSVKKGNSTYALSLKVLLKKLGNMYSKIVGQLQLGPVVVNAYAPLVKVVKLYIKLKKMPYFFNLNTTFSPAEKNNSIRNLIYKDSLSPVRFERLLAKLIPLFIPKSYVEDFSKLRLDALSTLPKCATSIFTANAYQSDEIFKVWAAEKQSLGVPLIIGQHGGTFGTAAVNQSEEHQKRIANNFVTWGWGGEGSDKVIRLSSFQLSGRASIKRKHDGSVLHVLSSFPRYFYQYYSMPVAGQYLVYIKNQIEFLTKLDEDALDQIRIRPDSSGSDRAWDTVKALSTAGYNGYIDESNDRLLSLLGRSRLCVCTNNATVFLETLALDFPTIIFWEPSHHEIRPDAVPFFDMLEEAEILFYSPEKAAIKVNDILSDVDEWWFSIEVQSARKKFCERYASTSNHWESEWGEVLIGAKKSYVE